MAVEKCEGPTSLSMRRRALPQTPGNYGGSMAKHEHMTSSQALTHAAIIGHVLRGTVLEGKPFEDAVAAAHSAVGEDSRHFQRRRKVDPHVGGPAIDEAFYPSLR